MEREPPKSSSARLGPSGRSHRPSAPRPSESARTEESAPAESLRVLLVEDRPGDARLLRETLASASSSKFDLTWVDQLGEAEKRLDNESFDAVLLDLSLPDSEGLETFLALHGRHSEVPIVVLTGLTDESIALRAVQEGAQDYLVKGQLYGDALARSILYAIERDRLMAEVDKARSREHSVFREVDRVKSDMIAFVAHEFQQTLNVLDDHATDLMYASPEKTRAIAQEIQAEVETEMKRLTSLIESFLEITESEASHALDLIRESFDVPAMVEESVKLAEAAASRCHFKIEIDEEVDSVRADRDKTMQVLVNLLANADHYSPRGGTVKVRVIRSDAQIRFEVRNAKVPPRERVRSLPAAAGRKGSAKGRFGTQASMALIEAQGGRFGVTSERGQGTVFYFTLPV